MLPPLPALPLLLAGCFDLDVTVELAKSGRTTVVSDLDVSPEAVEAIGALSPDLVRQARAKLKEVAKDRATTAALPPGAKLVTRPHGGADALGLTVIVRLPEPSVAGLGDAGMGSQAMTLRDLGGGLWELAYGSPRPPADSPLGNLKELGAALSMLGAAGGDEGGEGGPIGLPAGFGTPSAVTRIVVPGTIEAIEPSTGTVDGHTASWTIPTDLAGLTTLLDQGARYAVRFRTRPGFRFPDAAVTR